MSDDGGGGCCCCGCVMAMAALWVPITVWLTLGAMRYWGVHV